MRRIGEGHGPLLTNSVGGDILRVKSNPGLRRSLRDCAKLTPHAIALSETTSGKNWLENFEPNEVADAAALLDAIANISETTFRTDMKWLLQGVREANPDAVIAAFPLRGVPKDERETSSYTDMGVLPRGTGSELIVENILSKTRRATGFLLQPSVEEMRSRRVDVILFVTDTVASGSEAFQFISYFAANPSIRSWLSSKHVRFELAAHTVSEYAWYWLDSDRRLSSVHLVQPGADLGTAGWSKTRRKRIEALCDKYSDGRSDSFGHSGVSHLTIFGHTVGNGLPRILLQQAGPLKSAWIPLLPFDRAYGLDEDDELDTADYAALPSPEAIVESLRNADAVRSVQTQESAAIFAANDAAMSPVILLLVCLRLGIETDFQLMRYARMTRRRLNQVVQYSEDMGLITARKKLTQSGKDLIRKYGRKSRELMRSVHRDATDPYYPSQLR